MENVQNKLLMSAKAKDKMSKIERENAIKKKKNIEEYNLDYHVLTKGKLDNPQYMLIMEDPTREENVLMKEIQEAGDDL